MAWDSTRNRIVLFGGADWQRVFSDTWEWDGKNWTQIKPANSPKPQMGLASWSSVQAMAHDSVRQRTVLFLGGDAYSPTPSYGPETWEWDGKNWTQIKPSTSPPVRWDHAMAYDAARKRVVLFGGYYVSWAQKWTVGLADTWQWDGKNWTQINSTTAPSARARHAMAYDACRQRAVLFGGWDPYYFVPFSDETWEWDGKVWTQIKPSTSPGKRSSHVMAYDSARKRIVLFGGSIYQTGAVGDTWEWDGVNWTQINSTTSPSARYQHAMAYDSARQRMVLFGGNTPNSMLGDTWEYTGPMAPLTTDTCTVSIATGGVQKLLLSAGSQHGNRLYWIFGSLSGTTPGVTLGSAFGPVHIPLNPDVWTDYTIALPNTVMLIGTKATLDASGTALALFNVPKASLPSAIGLVFHHAYLVYDAKNNFYMASNAVPLQLVK